jgi:hypothetical protein
VDEELSTEPLWFGLLIFGLCLALGFLASEIGGGCTHQRDLGDVIVCEEGEEP